MGIKLSFSKISTYIECPRKYFLSYICNLGTGSSPYMTNGTIIHKCCEDFEYFGSDLENEIFNTKFSEMSETSEKCLENLIKYYYKLIPLIDKENLIHEEMDGTLIINPVFEQKAHKSLKVFYEDYTENFYEEDKKGNGPIREYIEPKIIQQEEWFQIKTKDGHEVRGLIDRIDEEPDGEHIIDYKSGQSRVTYKALQDPLDVKGMQLSIYALARYKQTGKIPYKSSFFYLEPNKNAKKQVGQYRTAPGRNKEQLEKVEEFLNNIGNEIEQATKEKNFPIGDSPNCFFCDFKNNCEIISAQQMNELNNKFDFNDDNEEELINKSMWED